MPYAELDRLIVEAIESGAKRFYMLNGRPAIVRAIDRRRDAARVVDARLQAMRRAGRIEYSGKTGWRVV